MGLEVILAGTLVKRGLEVGVLDKNCITPLPEGFRTAVGGLQGLLSSLPYSFGSLDRALSDAGGECVEIGNTILLPVVGREHRAFGVGKSFREHAREMGGGSVAFFVKAPGSLTGHNHPIILPPVSEKPDYEGEIVLIIGKRLRQAGSRGEAREAIAGYTAGNDVTDRGLQASMTWSIAKGAQTFGPLGPGAYISEDKGFLDELCIETLLNGERVQRGCVEDLVEPPEEIVRRLSQITTLIPGSVVFLGTPSGVGHARSPPRYLRAGDVVEVRVGSLPPLRNKVVRP